MVLENIEAISLVLLVCWHIIFLQENDSGTWTKLYKNVQREMGSIFRSHTINLTHFTNFKITFRVALQKINSILSEYALMADQAFQVLFEKILEYEF